MGLSSNARKKVIFDSHELYAMQLRQKPYLPGWCTRIIAFGYTQYERFVLRHLDGAIFPCTINGKDPFAGKCPHTALVDNSVKLEDFYERYDPKAIRNRDQICLTGSLTEARELLARSGPRRLQSAHWFWRGLSLRRTMRRSSGRCRSFPAWITGVS